MKKKEWKDGGGNFVFLLDMEVFKMYGVCVHSIVFRCEKEGKSFKDYSVYFSGSLLNSKHNYI